MNNAHFFTLLTQYRHTGLINSGWQLGCFSVFTKSVAFLFYLIAKLVSQKHVEKVKQVKVCVPFFQ